MEQLQPNLHLQITYNPGTHPGVASTPIHGYIKGVTFKNMQKHQILASNK